MSAFDRLSRVAHGWLPAFRRSAECEAILSSGGYKAFHIHRDFLAQFALEADDIAIHEACYIEYCKEVATRSPILSSHLQECRASYYRSPLLKEKRLELAMRSGYSNVEAWIADSKSVYWETEPDPLLRAKSKFLIPRGQEVLDHYKSSCREQVVAAIEIEAARFPKGETGSFLPQNRLDAFRSISQNYLAHLKFNPVSTRLKDYAALDLDISKDFVLRWSVGEDHSFFNVNFPAICQPTLHLRQKSFKQKIKNADQKVILLKFPYSMVVEGVGDVYDRCSDTRELEVIIHVHALMVEWVLPYIFEALASVRDSELPLFDK